MEETQTEPKSTELSDQQAQTAPPAESGEQGKPERTFTQTEVEAIVKERLEREARKRARAEEEARKRAEEEAARRNGEWQKLAEQREQELQTLGAKVAELEQILPRLEKYQAALQQYLAAERKGLPDPILKLLDKLDEADQLEWLSANREQIKAGMLPTSGQARIPRTPKADDGMSVSQTEDAKRRAEVYRMLRQVA